MDRLTEYHANKSLGAYMVCSMDCVGDDNDFICNDCRKLEEIVNLLASYEDTGLEPEKVEAQSIALAQCKPYIDAICDEHGKMLINPIRLAELAQAEKDGRLVVLPCKVGDFVFNIQDGEPYATRVLSFSYFGGHLACQTVSSFPDLNMFGERVFLTREEAEAALKKREEADNEAD